MTKLEKQFDTIQSTSEMTNEELRSKIQKIIEYISLDI